MQGQRPGYIAVLAAIGATRIGIGAGLELRAEGRIVWRICSIQVGRLAVWWCVECQAPWKLLTEPTRPVPNFTLELTSVPRTDRLGSLRSDLLTADGISQQERSISLTQR